MNRGSRWLCGGSAKAGNCGLTMDCPEASLGYKLLRRALKMVLKWTAQMRKRQALDKTGHSGGACSTKTH